MSSRRSAGALLLAALGACETAPRNDASNALGPPAMSASEAAFASASASAPAAPASAPASASASGIASPAPSASSALAKEPVGHDFSKGPLYFTPAYDGSLRFSLWLGTMRFARRMEAAHGKRPHFTFFVNGAFYSTDEAPSDVGRATSRAEVLVRRALTQQAVNEGHEIGNHGMGHLDGRAWSAAEWEAELARFHAVMDGTIFEPVRDASGAFAFPRWAPLESAGAGETGAACETDADCASKSCAALSETVGVCTQPCNLKERCPKGTACGAPMFREDTDICLPPPAFPVVADGETLFDAKGNANRTNKRLVPYRIVGFRAPYLAANDALYEALAARGYVYDTSQATSPPEPPYFLRAPGGAERVLELALMPHDGALAIPMDYNYRLEKGSPERMLADYRAALEASFRAGRRPWNVGHHFASWGEGTYLAVLESTVEHALAGCPHDGELRCPGAEVVSFRELARAAGAKR